VLALHLQSHLSLLLFGLKEGDPVLDGLIDILHDVIDYRCIELPPKK
jgi:hypothetical protein